MKSGIRVFSRRAMLACAVLGVAACTPTIDHRGYLAKPGAFDQVKRGMHKSEVESLLGSPSTTASVNLQGDSYYYISSITEQKAFMKPKETNREVIAIRFDGNDQVDSFGQYALEDGQVVDINSRETPPTGREASILNQIFGNLKAGMPF